ncbi:MAG: HemK2/MTQ2 family protein methyltransferase [Candidatus Micrarchaeia archaeon]
MVYSPREDSRLLEETVQEHAFGSVLDLGTGSGIQGMAAARNPRVESVLCVDVDLEALEAAQNNARAAGIAKARFLLSDLFSAITGQFDCIAFNPPYLPANPDECVNDSALESGEDGRLLTERFLREFPAFLKPDGIVLLLQSTVSDDGATKRSLEASGFHVEKIASQKFFFEELFVLKAMK